MHNKCQKHTHILNSHRRKCVVFFVHCIHVRAITSVSSSNSCIIWKQKNSMKMLSANSLKKSGASVCHNPLEPPVNLWTIGTQDREFPLSVHCVKLVSVVSPASVSLRKNAFVFPWMHVRAQFYHQFCDVSVWNFFLLIDTLLNALLPNTAHNKSNTFWLSD